MYNNAYYAAVYKNTSLKVTIFILIDRKTKRGYLIDWDHHSKRFVEDHTDRIDSIVCFYFELTYFNYTTVFFYTF